MTQKIEIPRQLKKENIRFIKVRKFDKAAFEHDFPTRANYSYQEIQDWLNKTGSNYGVLAKDNLVILDADILKYDCIDQTLKDDFLETLKQLGETFTVRTPNGGLHLYFFVDGEFMSNNYGDFYCEKCNKPHRVFDLQTKNKYVVGPGSLLKDKEGKIRKYEVIKAVEIVSVDGATLEKFLESWAKKHKIITRKALKEQVGNEIKKIQTKNKEFENFNINVVDIIKRWREINNESVKLYPHGNEFYGSHPIHGSTGGKNFWINPELNCWHCFRHSTGGGPLHLIAVLEGIIDCSESLPGMLKGEKFRTALDIAIEKYGLKLPSPEDIEKEVKEKRKQNFLRLVVKLPDNHIVTKWMNHFSKRTDAYEEYHFGAVITILSSMVNRKLKVTLNQGVKYPNTWIRLIGESTIARKSAVLDFVEMVNDTLGLLEKCAGDYSPEAYIEDLSYNPRRIFILDEEGKFFSKVRSKQYSVDFIYIECEVYDNKSFSRMLRSRGNKKVFFNVEDPYVVKITAIQPQAFVRYTDEEMLDSGYLKRFLYIYPQYPKEKYYPFQLETPGMKEEYLELLKNLGEIKKMIEKIENEEEFKWEEGAFSLFIKEQMEFEQKAQFFEDEHLISASGRLSEYALKLSMLFCVGDYEHVRKNGFEIKKEHVQEAWRLIKEYFLPSFRDVIYMIKYNTEKNLQEKILYHLRRKGGVCTLKELCMSLHVKKQEIEAALEALEKLSEEIETERFYVRGGTRVVIKLRENEKRDDLSVASVEELQVLKTLKNNENEKKSTDATLTTDSNTTSKTTQKSEILEKTQQNSNNHIFQQKATTCNSLKQTSKKKRKKKIDLSRYTKGSIQNLKATLEALDFIGKDERVKSLDFIGWLQERFKLSKGKAEGFKESLLHSGLINNEWVNDEEWLYIQENKAEEYIEDTTSLIEEFEKNNGVVEPCPH